MKKFIVFLLLPLLVACGANKKVDEVAPSKSILIPNSCRESKALSAVQSEIPGGDFIDTKWTPAPNTELADVLNNGGIACSFGISSAEIGATIKWVKDDKKNFEKWVPSWLTDGYQKVDLTSHGLSNGYFLQKAQSATQEFNVWILNFKAGGVWVSIGRTSGTSISDGAKLIEAVISK